MTTSYVDPVNGLDTNDGSSWALAWKTLKTRSFAAGDTILVAKSPETTAPDTVTATHGSVSVTTSTNLTGTIAQYTIIRIGGDNTLYMVLGINWNSGTSTFTITLYRPYRGTSGSGKSLTYFTNLPTSASQDWQPTAMVGTSANHITLQAGINTSNNAQDGFTILYGSNNNYCLYGTWTFVDMSRVATLYWTYPWTGALTDCTLTTCFAFRSTSYFGLNVTWTRVTINSLVSELGRWSQGITLYNCAINQPETAEATQPGWNIYNPIWNCVVTQWKNAGYSGYYSLQFASSVHGLRIIDAVLDELASGCTNLYVYVSGSLHLHEVFFQNPTLGAGTALAISAAASFAGMIHMSNVNGSATDHRTYLGTPDVTKYALLSYDSSVFNISPPSAKVSLFQSAYPSTIRHYIPCDAGVQKTISVYLRKNSSYGAATRPTMRLRWLTGTAPNLVSNVQDEVMADVNDSFQQVSYAVTPSVQGVIIMELLFQSANSGAVAWYEDIGVQ